MDKITYLWVLAAVFALIGVVLLDAAWSDVPRRSPGGWHTSRVTATRYKNKVMGYNIGFDFPENPDDCDRQEISEFIEAHGGNIYQGGGSPGATAYVLFRGVADRDSADKKILEVLPGLNRIMRRITYGLPVHIEKPSMETRR